MKRLYLQRLGLACVAALLAVFLFKSYAEDKPAADIPDAALDQPQVKSVGQYYFPNWVFDDPKGDNALITTSQLESSDKPLYRYTNYFKKFGPSFSKYSGKKTVMIVARTQAEFDDVLKTMAGPVVSPRKLNFDKELFVFVFNDKMIYIELLEGSEFKVKFTRSNCIQHFLIPIEELIELETEDKNSIYDEKK